MSLDHTPEMPALTCKNCGNLLGGKYCSACGQEANTGRLTAKAILHDLFHAFTHLDKGYLHSLRQMLFRPGHTIREYLEGKRVRHANPLLMLLIIGALGSFLYDRFQVASLNSVRIDELHFKLHVIASKFFALLSLVYCFLFTACDYFLFRYKKYYYSELYLFNVFQMVEIMVLNILLLPLWIFLGDSAPGDYARLTVYFLIIAYMIFARYQFFEVRHDAIGRKRLAAEVLIFLLLLVGIGWRTIYQILFS